MKHQALFFSKDKSKKLKCRLLQFLFSALRVKLWPKNRKLFCHNGMPEFLDWIGRFHIIF